MNNLKQIKQKELPPLETQFLKQSWRFVPKHLQPLINEEKKGKVGALQRKIKDKDATYQESAIQIIDKNKKKYLAPVKDLEQIMKHFETKFQNSTLNNLTTKYSNTNAKKRAHSNRIQTSIQYQFQRPQDLIQNKISKILQLPTIQKANQQAKRIKALSMEQSTKKSLLKQQILMKFDKYFSLQIDPIKKKELSPNNKMESQPVFRKLRAKTSID